MNPIEEFEVNKFNYSGGLIEQGTKGAITGILEKACGGRDDRYLVLKALTGKTSSKELTDADWYGLLCLVQPFKPEGGKWTTSIGEYELSVKCKQIIAIAAKQAGQMEMPL